ncbi:MAG: RNA methyltransferase [Alphaproteobacteria bacterium]
MQQPPTARPPDMVDPEPTKREAVRRTPDGGPAIILVDPQLGENIGMAARAMLNFGLTDLRLVRPRGAWPNAKAIATAVGAHPVLDSAQLFDNTEDAVADLQRLAATTARLRDMIKDVQPPRDWAQTAITETAAGRRCGVLFGRERAGLHNDDLALADTLLTIPANPAFSSLNLAQTVLLIGYEWRLAGGAEVPSQIRRKGHGAIPASQSELQGFYDHLEDELDRSGFLRVAEKRPRMVRNIRNIFNRAQMTEQEVRTLRGVIVALAEKKGKGGG